MAFKREKALAAAQKYASKGQHDKAVAQYQAIVENEPKDLRSWLMLADSLVRAEKPEEAVPRYMQVAKSYGESKDYSKALAVYRQVLAIDPRRVDVHLKCAQLHADLRQIPEAVGIFEKVARAYLKQGRTNDAIDLFRRVADLDSQTVTRRLRLAELYSREKMNTEAVAAFRQAGALVLEQGLHEDYVRIAERLLYHQPGDRETTLGIVRAYLKLRQPRRALVKLNGVLQDNPNDVVGLELLCETFVRLGKVDKAVSVVLEIVREHAAGSDPNGHARRVLERGMEWAPKNADLRQAWTDLTGEGILDEDQAALDIGFADSDEMEVEEIEEIEELEELDEFEEIEELEEFDFEDGEDGEDGENGEAEEDEFADAALAPSLTDAVMADVGSKGPSSDEDQMDLDRQLQEAKVLAKYRLHDNALGHITEVLASDERHEGALLLQVEVFTAMERTDEAADSLVRLAENTRATDPGRASAYLRDALELAPGHSRATELAAEIGPETVVRAAPTAEDEDDDIDFDLSESDDDFAIELDDEDELPEVEENFPVEDRFGLPDESEELPVGGISDVSEEVEDIEALLAQGREADARDAFLALERKHPAHPALSGISERFATAQPAEEDDPSAAVPLFDFQDDEEGDDYLTGIFSDDDDDDEPAEPKGVEHRARAQVQGEDTGDPATAYDLATAYHGMGLVDNAMRELEKAAVDPDWTARACILMASVRRMSGDDVAAREALERAAAAAQNADERSESNYELGEWHLAAGDKAAAKTHFELVSPGFRDREAQLSAL